MVTSLSMAVRALMLSILIIGMELPFHLLYAAEPVKIGVLSFRPKPLTQAEWQPLADALKKAIPERDFIIEALTFPELETAVASHQLDFALTNSSHYIFLSHHSGLSAPIATQLQDVQGHAKSVFGGVIFCLRANTLGINSLADLKGKTVAAVSTNSFGGYLMQVYELNKFGISIERDTKFKTTGMPHDNVVNAVLSGQADVGFVRSGVLESMAHEGKLDMANIKILNPQKLPDFPAQVSTRLYPEWAFVALANHDDGFTRRVAAALFLLDSDTAATRAMGNRGFTIPADYAPVAEMLRDLRMPPFESAPQFDLYDVWTQYRVQIISALIGSVFLLLLFIRLIQTKRKLNQEHDIVLLQQNQLQQFAFYDTLTLLPNRRLLNDRLNQTMATSKRTGRYCSLIYLDLDNFKPVNDKHGHDVGDALLIEVANRIKICVREMDTVARMGGDEFVVVLSELSADKAEATSQVHMVAEKIRTALSTTYLLNIKNEGKAASTIECHCSASIGVVVFKKQEADQHEILKLADAAMFDAKKSGHNKICFNESEI